jgi:uncharacterized membrane protein YeiB
MTAPTNQRLDGLDLARFLALGGMMLVNFRLAMHPPKGSAWLEAFFHFFEGKASATFVSLAGLGLVLATTSKSTLEAYSWVTRRALFLLVAGLLNLLVFPADIIHYYAAYFILALPWLKAGKTALAAGIVAVAVVSTCLLLTFDYGEGWDWNTLSYDSLWTLEGFVRNLLFNGFHPVLPWLAFFLTGMLMARLPLHLARVQLGMVFGGIFLCLLAGLVSHLGRHSAIAWTLHTSPMPPGIAYLLTGMGSATIVIGACLLVSSNRAAGPWRFLLPAGRMTLTLYLAHILVGMGTLEAVGALDGSRSLAATTVFSVGFLVASTLAAHLWSLKFSQGPVESLMRFVTGSRSNQAHRKNSNKDKPDE